MSRSKKKSFFIRPYLVNFFYKLFRNKNTVSFVKKTIYSRSSVIIKPMLAGVIALHTGNRFKKMNLNKDQLNLKLGALTSTRAVFVFKKKKKKNEVTTESSVI